MSTQFELPEEERLRAGDLVAAVGRKAVALGPNQCEWPGLTFYRFDGPEAAQWDDVRSLSLCMVVQGRKRVRVGEVDFFYDPFNYFVLTRGMRFQAEILTGSVAKPFLSLVMQVEPAIVQKVAGDMRQRTLTLFQRPLPPLPRAFVSAIDQNLTGAVLRFLNALDTEPDRAVLAPMYLQEIVYRVLQTEHCEQLLRAARQESETNPVSAAIALMRDDIARSVTVADLADAVAMSPSAFAHVFKSATGVSPYRFLKRLRLDRARVMLVEEGRSVTEAAAAVGYSSISHFINEFKRHFGVTPGSYATAQREAVALSVSRMTGSA